MTANEFPGPVEALPIQEHEVAAPGRAQALLDAIADDPNQLTRLHRRHIISIRDFDADLLRQVFRRAAAYEMGLHEDARPMSGKVMANLFLDHTRPQTRLSFDRAWLKLGGNFLGMDQTIDELLSNRVAMDEVAACCNSTGDIVLARVPREEMLSDLLQYMRVPVINTGNGTDENPTNGIADLYTLFKWRPELLADQPAAEKRLQIGIIGDPSRTRTIRSLLYGLSKFPRAVKRVVMMSRLAQLFSEGQREELSQSGLKIETIADLYPTATILASTKAVVSEMDLIYMHQLQATEYRRADFVELKEALQPHTMMLDPEIHLQEFSDMMNDSPHNGYFAQARGAVYVRMALLNAVMGDGG